MSFSLSHKIRWILGGILLEGALLGLLAYGWWYRHTEIIPELRAREMDNMIAAAAEYHRLSPQLIRAVIWKESRFQPELRGKHGEIGLMQLTPVAVREWRDKTRAARLPTEKELFDPWINIYIGSWYLAWCGQHWQNYRSAEILQLAEYNAGYTRVSKLWKPPSPDVPLPIENITFPGTRDYVRRILGKKHQYSQEVISAEDGL